MREVNVDKTYNEQREWFDNIIRTKNAKFSSFLSD